MTLMVRRFERLYKAFRPDLLKPDDAWAYGYLQPEERGLYGSMDVRDREHALQVAKRLLEHYPDAPEYAVRAALLHDAGKAVRVYRPLERILTGLIHWSTSAEPLQQGWWGAVQVRQHHPLYAARRIGDPAVAQIVLEHHAPQSLWAMRLHEVDQEF